jgi:ubiquinone/menaquinone biosynthesis C-methylase UbiE
MPEIKPFQTHALKYDEWYDKNPLIYQSELEAVKELLPEGGRGLEVGVGTGRFVSLLGVRWGLDPSLEMGEIARERGVKFIQGVAESLPLSDREFDYILMVTTICFLDDLAKALREAYRVLKPNGSIVIGFIDAESQLGNFYHEHKGESTFYRQARFYSVEEVTHQLKKAHFKDIQLKQTLFKPMGELKEREPVKEGHGEGSFIVVRGVKNIIV